MVSSLDRKGAVGLTIAILVLSFLFMLLINMPIAFSLGLSTLFTLVAINLVTSPDIPPHLIIAQKMATGVDSFTLLAIPFFILSGLLMGRGGIATRLIDCASSLMGRLPGGLGYVNVVTSMLFGALSGSAAAAVSSIGGFMIPEMRKQDYDDDFSVAITTTSSVTGLLIPPSNAVIIYAVVSGGVSISAMFFAGILPGLVFGLCLMAVGGWMARKRGYTSGRKSSFIEIITSFKRAFLSLLLVVFVLGGILGGVFTPTEAAVIAVAYSFFLSVVLYKTVKFAEIPEILIQCSRTTAIVMILIGASMAMSWLLTSQDIPQTFSRLFLSISDNKIVIFVLINMLLLFVGTFMDMTPAILIFTPILLPVVTELGMHPVHFGILMVANLCIGLCTPPVGTCLFVGCSVGKIQLADVVKTMIPFFGAMVVALLLITFFPALSLYIPKMAGLIK